MCVSSRVAVLLFIRNRVHSILLEYSNLSLRVIDLVQYTHKVGGLSSFLVLNTFVRGFEKQTLARACKMPIYRLSLKSRTSGHNCEVS